MTLDEYADRELMTVACEDSKKVDTTVELTCEFFSIPRQRRLINVKSVIFGKSNSRNCADKLEERCYDFSPNFVNIVKSM